MIVFSAQNESYRKRKRVHRACDQCRKRRRRCEPSPTDTCALCQKDGLPCSLNALDHFHASTSSQPFGQLVRTQSDTVSPVLSLPKSESKEESAGEVIQRANDYSPQDSTTGTGSRKAGGGRVSRFVGDLNPEAQLLEKSTPSSRQSSHERGDIGVWVKENRPRRMSFDRDGNAAGAVATRDSSPESTSPVRETPVNLRRLTIDTLTNYIDSVRRLELPADQDVEAMITIYFKQVNSTIPVLDEVVFRREYEKRRIPFVLLLAIMLVASRHDSAQPHLRFQGDTLPMDQRSFAHIVYSAISGILKAEVEADKVVLIQTLALLSLHSEGAQGNEAASLHLSTAVHHVQTIGLHLPRGSTDDRRNLRIFWTIWSLDRLNAGINGRAVFIHERDVGERPVTFCTDTAERIKFGAFDIWLRIAALLDKVIAMYRPSKAPEIIWEHGFPTFDEVVGDDVEGLTPTQIAMLELFYHAVAILSCRIRPSTPLPPSAPSRVLQSLSALRIVKIASEQDLGYLPPVPVIPYAIALSMTVAYRQYREAKLPMHKLRAKTDWENAYTVLARLGKQWWSAEALANLGRQAMERHERHSRPSSNVNSPDEPSKSYNGQVASSTGYSSNTNGHSQQPYLDSFNQPSGSNPADITPLPGTETQQFFNGINHAWPASAGGPLYETLDSFLQASFPDPTYSASFLDPILWDDSQMYTNAYQPGNGNGLR